MTDSFEQLKAQYLATFDAKYLEIEKALHDENHAALLFLVHRLIGSAGSYGFDRISETCVNLEHQLSHSPSFNDQITLTSQLLLKLMLQAKV